MRSGRLADRNTLCSISVATRIGLLSRTIGLVSFANDQVTFRWRDSAHHNKKRVMTLHLNEFLRRFLLHVLPLGFVRIRHFGFLSTRKRSTLLPLCFRLLGATSAERKKKLLVLVNNHSQALPGCALTAMGRC